MQAVILAGGAGIRLRPLTHITPKLMLKIYERPFLEHHVINLREQGIDDIILLVGYLGGIIKSHFGNGSKFGVRIRYSEDEMLGTGGAVKNAEKLLENEFMVLNGDTFLPIDYSAVIERFRSDNRLGLISVYDNRERIRDNNIAVINNEVVEYNNKETRPYFSHVDAGVSIFKRSALNLIGEKKFSLENDLYPKLIRMKELSNFPTSQRFFDIHVMERVDNLNRLFEVI